MKAHSIALHFFALGTLLAGAAKADGLDLRPESYRTTVNCSSNDDHFNTCPVPGGIEYVALRQQLSRAACVQGRTWGYSRNGVWVDRGCRAIFEVTLGGGSPVPPPPGYSEDIACASQGYSLNRCYTRGGYIRAVQLVRQESTQPCVQNSTFGSDGNAVWVSNGCRGIFRVYHGR